MNFVKPLVMTKLSHIYLHTYCTMFNSGYKWQYSQTHYITTLFHHWSYSRGGSISKLFLLFLIFAVCFSVFMHLLICILYSYEFLLIYLCYFSINLPVVQNIVWPWQSVIVLYIRLRYKCYILRIYHGYLKCHKLSLALFFVCL